MEKALNDIAPDLNRASDPDPITDDEIGLSPDFVRNVVDRIDAGDAPSVRAAADGLHPSDVAELLELLRPDERRTLVAVLGPDFDIAALSELDEGLRDEVLGYIGPGRVAEALADLDTDDAVYLLEDMDESAQQALLSRMPDEDRAQIERSLEYEEDSAGRLMQRDVVVVPPHWNVGQTIDHLREADDLPETFSPVPGHADQTSGTDPGHHGCGTDAYPGRHGPGRSRASV